jgi:hypothetical protein
VKKCAVVGAIALGFAAWLAEPPRVRAIPPLELKIQSPVVELLNPGTGNREQLRFKPSVNSRQQMVMTLDQQGEVTVGGNSLPNVAVPATQLTIETTITKVEPNGDIHYQFRYVDIQLLPKASSLPTSAIAEIQAQLAKLKGIQGTAVMDAQGRTKSSNLMFADTVDAATQKQFKQLFESAQQATVPLPDAPVGVGAQWKATNSLTVTGIQVKQTITYELVDLKPGQAAIAFRLEQQAPPQAVPTLTGAAPGITAMLQSYDAQGQGNTTIDLTEPFKIRTKSDLRQVAQVNLEDPKSAQKTQFGMTINLNLAIEPK